MIALDYENIICAAFNCERGCRHGATTDQYYSLINYMYDEFERGVRCGFLAAYILEALYEVRDLYLDNKEFQSNIEDCIDLLIDPTVDNINNSILKANAAFKMVKLIDDGEN